MLANTKSEILSWNENSQKLCWPVPNLQIWRKISFDDCILDSLNQGHENDVRLVGLEKSIEHLEQTKLLVKKNE